ncbi:MAG: hypothetical protein QT11_C0001G0136 [archaeon GW2011_AR20]|nr:MAG: hypothetical protein QT11_C0001G0136 [archaeon GW2011_AR20]MBS3160692.1 DUF2073 domain-containing protein [Candidatus Woesearchaeota archaeon]
MLTLQFVPYTEIRDMSSLGRIRKLLNMAKENKIVLLEGRLNKEEEAELIKTTMEEINASFRGIELAVVNPNESDDDVFSKLKSTLATTLLGNRQGFTIIGPATVIKNIKRDPNKLQLMMKDATSKSSRSSKKHRRR